MASIDKFDFAELAITTGNFCGVHPHYLAAIAQKRSGLSDDIVAGAFGPYLFSQSLWNNNLHFPGSDSDFEPSDINDWTMQCSVFAQMTRRTLDAWQLANNGQTPDTLELYLAQLAADGLPPPDAAAQARLLDDLNDALAATQAAVQKAGAALLGAIDDPVQPLITPQVVLFRRSPPSAPVKGHLIARLQTALIARGRLPATTPTGERSDDGWFGPDTERALEAWQASKGYASTGALTFGQWTELTDEPAPSLYDRCAQLTAAFEGTDFGGTNATNVDNTILTFGYHGYTLTGGSLLKFLGQVNASSAQLIDSTFDAGKAAKLRTLCAASHNEAVAQAPAIFLAGDTVDADWRNAFLAFGTQPECQQLQLAFSRKEYWLPAEAIRSTLKMSEGLGSALCFDIAVQNGPNMAVASAVAAQYGGSESELEKRTLIADAITRGARFADDVRQRKQAISIGTGTVHGGSYDLANWGFADGESAEVPDAPIKVSPPQPNATFEAWFKSQLPNQSDFTAAELLTKGRQNEANHLNTDPPRELWPNILPTISLLIALKQALGGAAITLNSVYRSPAYNESVHGARDSQHMHFRATDIVVHNGSPPSQWAAALHQLRSNGVFRGGIGLYPSFVHVDTRGFNTNWG